MRIEQNNSGLNLNANAKTTEQMLDHFWRLPFEGNSTSL